MFQHSKTACIESPIQAAFRKCELFIDICFESFKLLFESCGKSVKLSVKLIDALNFFFPELGINAEDFFKLSLADLVLDSLEVDILSLGNIADGSFNSINLALTAVDNPIKNTKVIAEACLLYTSPSPRD